MFKIKSLLNINKTFLFKCGTKETEATVSEESGLEYGLDLSKLIFSIAYLI